MSFFNVERKKKKGAGDKHTVTHALKKKNRGTNWNDIKKFSKTFHTQSFFKNGWMDEYKKSQKKEKVCNIKHVTFNE